MQVNDILQYGALGLLCLGMIGAYRLVSKLIDRAVGTFDAIAKSLHTINEQCVRSHEAIHETRADMLVALDKHESAEINRLHELKDDIVDEVRLWKSQRSR